jgi:ribosomal protein S18 acetylase RimI-like enzyme
MKMYVSVGFKIAGRRENYYAEIGEDALIMWTGSPPYET